MFRVRKLLIHASNDYNDCSGYDDADDKLK